MSEWRTIAEWDWVQAGRYGSVLHAVASIANEATVDSDWFGQGATVCGRGSELYIPGVFSRMGAKRCNRCCDRLGFPRGDQSPKNVDACRPLVEARLAALLAEPARFD